MRHRPLPSTAARRAAVLLLVTAISLSACGDDGDGSSDGDATGGDPSSPSEDSGDTAGAGPSADESESEAQEPSAGDAPTPPGTVLDADDPAVVEIPDSVSRRPVGTFAVTVDSVTAQPLSKLPADVDPGPSDLYFVEQTYTLLEKRTSLAGSSLLEHTQVVSDGQPVQSVISVGSNPRGCSFATFRDSDEDGTDRESCTAYLVPRGQDVEAVGYIARESAFDYIDGNPIRWELDD